MSIPDGVELQSPTKKEWSLIPEDVYQTEITNLEYKIEPNRYKEREKDPVKKAQMPDEKQIINFEFTIIEEGEMYGRKLWQKMTPMKPYPPTGTVTSWMYRLASAMAGHPITSAEADTYTSSDVNGYIHRQVQVVVKHSVPDANGKVWNNIESFLKAKQQLPPFDVNKVPVENQPAPVTTTQTQEMPVSGYDKFKAASQNTGTTNRAVQSNVEPEIAPDIAVAAQQIENGNYPFDGVNDPF